MSQQNTTQTNQSSYLNLINELERDINRSAPSDLLQFCSAWFQYKLEQERTQIRQQLSQLNQVYQQQQPLQQHQQQHTYHSQFPSNHPSQYHHQQPPPPPPPPPQQQQQQHHHQQQQQQQQPSNTVQPVPYYCFNQPPPNNFPTSTTHQQQPAFPPQTTLDNNRPYTFGPPSSNPPHPPSAQPSPLQVPPTSSYSSPSIIPISQPQQPLLRPSSIINHHYQEPISPSHSLRSPAPTYHTSPGSLRRYSLSATSNNRAITALPPPVPPVVEEPSDDSSSDDSSHVPLVPAGYNFGRRVSVSAESLSPLNRDDGPPAPKKVVPKTPSQRQRIENSIKDNLLFRYLDEEQHDDVVNAMEELTVTQGTEVIVQGAVGDFFYVVEQGTFDVYIRGPRTYTYVPAPSNESQGTLTLAGENLDPLSSTGVARLSNGLSASTSPDLASSNQGGSTPFAANGTTVSHQAPSKKVNHYGPGGAFGELALMHNAPRAATVVATSPTATLWALDRITFRSILINHTARKRKMYENFLSEVPIFASLSPTEISKIADSLEDRSFAEGVDVIKEGEIGREFFIIEAGRAEVYKKRGSSLANINPNSSNGNLVEEELVGILGKGDHFGELALLNSAPRAATVRVAQGTPRLRVAALGEKAFTRLLGPVIDILSRHAASHYGSEAAQRMGRQEPMGSGSTTGGGGSEGAAAPGSAAHGLNSPRSTTFSLPPLPASSSSTTTGTTTANDSPAVGRPNPAVGFASWNGLNGRVTPAHNGADDAI